MRSIALALILLLSGCSNTAFGRWTRSSDVDAYLAENPTTRPEVAEAIRNGKVLVGMTWPQVELAVGRPPRVNRTVTAFGTHEQLIYPSHFYVYLDNDIVTAVQD